VAVHHADGQAAKPGCGVTVEWVRTEMVPQAGQLTGAAEDIEFIF